MLRGSAEPAGSYWLMPRFGVGMGNAIMAVENKDLDIALLSYLASIFVCRSFARPW